MGHIYVFVSDRVVPMSISIGHLTMNTVHIKTDFINWNFKLLWTLFLFELHRTFMNLKKLFLNFTAMLTIAVINLYTRISFKTYSQQSTGTMNRLFIQTELNQT